MIEESLGATRLLWVPNDRGNFVVGFWPTLTSGVYHVVGTVPVTDRRWRRLEAWVHRASPRVFVPFLSATEFEEIVGRLPPLARSRSAD